RAEPVQVAGELIAAGPDRRSRGGVQRVAREIAPRVPKRVERRAEPVVAEPGEPRLGQLEEFAADSIPGREGGLATERAVEERVPDTRCVLHMDPGAEDAERRPQRFVRGERDALARIA